MSRILSRSSTTMRSADLGPTPLIFFSERISAERIAWQNDGIFRLLRMFSADSVHGAEQPEDLQFALRGKAVQAHVILADDEHGVQNRLVSRRRKLVVGAERDVDAVAYSRALNQRLREG